MKSAASIAVMCALSLALVSCGGNKPAATDTGGEQQTTQSTESAKVEEKKNDTAVGTWKVAAVEVGGIKATGDFSTFASAMNADSTASQAFSMTLTLKEDGTGSISMGGNSNDMTWSQSGADITITSTKSSTSGSTEAKGTLKDGVLRFVMDDSNNTVLLMTQDGKYPDAKSYDKSASKPITSENELLGTWNLVGMQMAGLTMTGDGADLSKEAGYDSATVTFSSGGKANMFGAEANFTVSSDGTKLTDGTTSAAEVRKLDNNLFIDLSSVMGTELFMILSK